MRVPGRVALQILIFCGFVVSISATCVHAEQTPAADPAESPDEEFPAEVSTEETPEQANELSLDERLDALLQDTLSADDYQDSVDCLSRRAYRQVKILGNQMLLFSKRDKYWINRLKRPCPGLSPRMVLTFSSPSQSICRGEFVYVSDRYDLASGFDSAGRPHIIRGVCLLGEFELISEQAALVFKELPR